MGEGFSTNESFLKSDQTSVYLILYFCNFLHNNAIAAFLQHSKNNLNTKYLNSSSNCKWNNIKLQLRCVAKANFTLLIS